MTNPDALMQEAVRRWGNDPEKAPLLDELQRRNAPKIQRPAPPAGLDPNKQEAEESPAINFGQPRVKSAAPGMGLPTEMGMVRQATRSMAPAAAGITALGTGGLGVVPSALAIGGAAGAADFPNRLAQGDTAQEAVRNSALTGATYGAGEGALKSVPYAAKALQSPITKAIYAGAKQIPIVGKIVGAPEVAYDTYKKLTEGTPSEPFKPSPTTAARMKFNGPAPPEAGLTSYLGKSRTGTNRALEEKPAVEPFKFERKPGIVRPFGGSTETGGSSGVRPSGGINRAVGRGGPLTNPEPEAAGPKALSNETPNFREPSQRESPTTESLKDQGRRTRRAEAPLSAPEMKNRAQVASRSAVELQRNGLRSKDLDTAAGKQKAFDVIDRMSQRFRDPHLYRGSTDTLEATRTQMQQWEKLGKAVQ